MARYSRFRIWANFLPETVLTQPHKPGAGLAPEQMRMTLPYLAVDFLDILLSVLYIQPIPKQGLITKKGRFLYHLRKEGEHE